MSHRLWNLLSVVWWGTIPSLGGGALGMAPSDALGWSFPSPRSFPHKCTLILLTWRPSDSLSGQHPSLRSSALQTLHTLVSHLPAPLTGDVLPAPRPGNYLSRRWAWTIGGLTSFVSHQRGLSFMPDVRCLENHCSIYSGCFFWVVSDGRVQSISIIQS